MHRHFSPHQQPPNTLGRVRGTEWSIRRHISQKRLFKVAWVADYSYWKDTEKESIVGVIGDMPSSLDQLVHPFPAAKVLINTVMPLRGVLASIGDENSHTWEIRRSRPCLRAANDPWHWNTKTGPLVSRWDQLSDTILIQSYCGVRGKLIPASTSLAQLLPLPFSLLSFTGPRISKSWSQGN